MNERARFIAQAKLVLRPALLADGFRIAGTTYRRITGEVIHIIRLQGSRDGGSCCVCLGIHLTFLPTLGFCGPCDPAKLTEPDCTFRTRLAPAGNSDCWWSYGTSEAEARFSAESIRQLYEEVGATYFDRYSAFPEDFVRLTPAMLVSDAPAPFPIGGTLVQRALAACRIAMHAGRDAEAKQFAEIGKAHLGSAVGLKRDFQHILTAT